MQRVCRLRSETRKCAGGHQSPFAYTRAERPTAFLAGHQGFLLYPVSLPNRAGSWLLGGSGQVRTRTLSYQHRMLS